MGELAAAERDFERAAIGKEGMMNLTSLIAHNLLALGECEAISASAALV